MAEADKVVHPFKKFDKLSALERIKRYFTPLTNYGGSKRVAKNIADKCPDYLWKLSNNNNSSIYDFDHVILSQTSKGVIDRIEFGLAEKIREELKLNPNIRLELKAAIDEIGGESTYALNKEKHLLTTNLFRIIENDNWAKLNVYKSMTQDEIELMHFMVFLHQSLYRTYDQHSYTGVASIPMAIAQGVIDKKIDLEYDKIAMVASGLGGKMQGALVNN